MLAYLPLILQVNPNLTPYLLVRVLAQWGQWCVRWIHT